MAHKQEDWTPNRVFQFTQFIKEQLARFDLNAVDRDVLRRLFLKSSAMTIIPWIEEGRLKPQVLGLDFLKAVAFHPDWETDPWIVELRRNGPAWARELTFDEGMSEKVLGWLGDVRRFAPSDMGFAWLLKLAARGEPRYHNFAVETMIKGFTPADFAPSVPEAAAAPAAGPATVDLGGASFLFTGKLATMQRKEAEDKVRRAAARRPRV